MPVTLKDHLANLLVSAWTETGVEPDLAYCQNTAELLLSDSTLAAIYDLAAYYQDEPFGRLVPAEAQALLTNWRASRAEQEPER